MLNGNFIFDELILACRGSLAVQNVNQPSYYKRVREIHNAAITSDPNDVETLKALSAELELLGCHWSPGQRAAYNSRIDELIKQKGHAVQGADVA
jgi:hypothetical protein